MTEEEKDRLVEKVMEGFDFEKAWSIMYLTAKDKHFVQTMADLKKEAEKFLRIALEHQDRAFWWIGGLDGHGGLCAAYDDLWGLSLNYIAVAKKVRISKK